MVAKNPTDAATMEQMAMCIRYYDINMSEMEEKFIGFSECESTTGNNLAKANWKAK